MTVLDYDDYRAYVRKRILSMPKKGYGQYRKLAEHLNVSTTYISQIFQSDKSLSPEQGAHVAEYFGMNDIESEYFVKLILLERSGSEKLKRILEKDIQKIKTTRAKVASRLDVKKVLSDEDKAIFYSDWHYSAIRLLVAIPGFGTPDAIAKHLSLPLRTVNEAIQFMVKTGLCIEEKNQIRRGPSRTHVDSDSTFVRSHHMNWRFKALEQVKNPDPEKLHYSAPMTVGKKDVEKIKSILLEVIGNVGKIVDTAPDEELMCLNIDWFKICEAK